MKKTIIFICLIGLSIPLMLTSQDAVDTWKGTELESEFYSVDLMIYRISPHPDGYRIEYYQPNGELFAVYASMDWFEDNQGGPGQIVWGDGEQYPYMTIFYKAGAISHIRLYLFDNQYHTSWGVLDRNKDYSEKFNIPFESFTLNY